MRRVDPGLEGGYSMPREKRKFLSFRRTYDFPAPRLLTYIATENAESKKGGYL